MLQAASGTPAGGRANGIDNISGALRRRHLPDRPFHLGAHPSAREQGGVASRFGLPLPSIRHVGLMTLLHPVADWLAIAAEVGSAMLAATGEVKGGLCHARGLGTPKFIQPPESHVAGRGVGAGARAYSGWRRFRPQRYTRISGDESHGRVPVIDDDGTVVWESQTILRYLAAKYGRGRFWSDDPGERSLAERWMDWSQASLQPDFLMGVFWGFYRTPEAQRNMPAVNARIRACTGHFQLLNRNPRRSPVLMRRQPDAGRYPHGHLALSVFRDRYRAPVRAECRSVVSAASGAPCLSGTHHGAIR